MTAIPASRAGPAPHPAAGAVSQAELTTRSDEHPFVARARSYAEQELRPAALDTDASGVGPATVQRLRELGLLTYHGPAALGGAALDDPAERRLHEHISAGCLNTWLVWAQHCGTRGRVVRAVQNGRPASELANGILRGERLAGAGISDVRGFPDRYIEARRIPGGWELHGTISWVSGWGLNSVLIVAGVEAATERVIAGLVAVGERTRATPLALSAARGSRTERVVLDGARLNDEDVLEVMELAQWRAQDLIPTTNAGPHAFGLAAAMLDELRGEPHPEAREVATVWTPRIARLRAGAYELASVAASGSPLAHVDERVAIKVAVCEALQTLARALVLARAGRGLVADDTAQLHARNALFVLVQGQSSSVRAAQLARLADHNALEPVGHHRAGAPRPLTAAPSPSSSDARTIRCLNH